MDDLTVFVLGLLIAAAIGFAIHKGLGPSEQPLPPEPWPWEPLPGQLGLRPILEPSPVVAGPVERIPPGLWPSIAARGLLEPHQSGHEWTDVSILGEPADHTLLCIHCGLSVQRLWHRGPWPRVWDCPEALPEPTP